MHMTEHGKIICVEGINMIFKQWGTGYLPLNIKYKKNSFKLKTIKCI